VPTTLSEGYNCFHGIDELSSSLGLCRSATDLHLAWLFDGTLLDESIRLWVTYEPHETFYQKLIDKYVIAVNSLPHSLKHTDGSLSCFQNQLKTFSLFSLRKYPKHWRLLDDATLQKSTLYLGGPTYLE